MPVYEYTCNACHHEFEEIQKFSDAPIKVCPKCRKKTVVKKVSLTAFQLKGEGWYKDGYSRPSDAPKKETKASTDSTATSTSTETKAKDSKAVAPAKSEKPASKAKAKADK